MNFFNTVKELYGISVKNRNEWKEVKKICESEPVRCSYSAFVAGKMELALKHPFSIVLCDSEIVINGDYLPVSFERNYMVNVVTTPKEAYLFIEYAGIFLNTAKFFGHESGMLYRLDPKDISDIGRGKSIFESTEVTKNFEEFVRERPDSDDKNKDIIVNYQYKPA